MSLIPGWDTVTGAHWWSNIYFWASIASLILLGVFEVVSHRYAERHDDLVTIERDNTDSAYNRQIAELHRDAARLTADAEAAKKEIATANEAAAKANERAAETERQTAATQREAAQANERAAQLQQAAAWRVLPPETKTKIAEGLARLIGWSVEISYPANDPEALFLAAQVEDVFKMANRAVPSPSWRMTTQPRMYSHGVFFGIRIFGRNTDTTNSVRAIFSSVQVPYTGELVPAVLNDSPGLTISGDFLTDVTIFVGSKHPPN
jgi:hypothetical protein